MCINEVLQVRRDRLIRKSAFKIFTFSWAGKHISGNDGEYAIISTSRQLLTNTSRQGRIDQIMFFIIEYWLLYEKIYLKFY